MDGGPFLDDLSETSVDKALLERLFDPETMPEYLPFLSPPMVKLPNSYIKFFKNGQDLGIAYKDIYQGKYHPAISLYRHGNVTANFGPDFKFAGPSGSRPFSDACNLPMWTPLLENLKLDDRLNHQLYLEKKRIAKGSVKIEHDADVQDVKDMVIDSVKEVPRDSVNDVIKDSVTKLSKDSVKNVSNEPKALQISAVAIQESKDSQMNQEMETDT
jgi:hypothetical protein